jgi:hypothetical protein
MGLNNKVNLHFIGTKLENDQIGGGIETNPIDE